MAATPTDVPNATVNDMAGAYTRPEFWAFVPNTAQPHEFYKTAAVMKFDWKAVSSDPQLSGSVDALLEQLTLPLTDALVATLPEALRAADGSDVKIDVLAQTLAKALAQHVKPAKKVKSAPTGQPTLVLGVIPPGENLAAFMNVSRPTFLAMNVARPPSTK